MVSKEHPFIDITPSVIVPVLVQSMGQIDLFANY